MRKFGVQLFIFLLIFSVVVIAVTKFDNVGRCYNKNANIQKLTCMQSFDSLDILFVGNSYCYSGINTTCFDSAKIKCFNLGVSSSGPNFYDVLINDYLRSAKTKPRSVFILVSPMILSSKCDDAMNNPIYRYLNDPISNEKYILNYDPTLVSSYPKISARSFARAWVGAYIYVTAKENFCGRNKNDMFLSKGFIPSNVVNSLKSELKTEHFYLPLLKDKFNEKKAQKLVEIAEGLDKQNIKAVFYELPSNKLYTYFNKEYLNGYYAFLKRIEAKYSYLLVKEKMNAVNYRDQDHLNSSGSVIACRALIKQIKERDVLPYQKK